MSELPFMPLYIDDYEAATAHLSMLEDGAYNRLLRLCWRSPGCKIPNDDDWILRKLRAVSSEERAAVRSVLDEFFTTGRGKIWSKRLLGEYLQKSVAHAKKVEAGKKGAAAKALKNKDTWSSKAKAELKQPDPDPEREEGAAVRAGAPEPPAEPADQSPDLAELLFRVMAAVGLNPNDIPSAHWMPNVAERHLLGWRNAGIPPDVIVRIARESRQRHPAPPNGPKALDAAMRAWLTAQSAPAFTAPVIPLSTGPSDARRPAQPSRLERVLGGAVARAEARAAALDRGTGEDAPRELLEPKGGRGAGRGGAG